MTLFDTSPRQKGARMGHHLAAAKLIGAYKLPHLSQQFTCRTSRKRFGWKCHGMKSAEWCGRGGLWPHSV